MRITLPTLSLAFALALGVAADYQTVNYDVGNISAILTTLDNDVQGVVAGTPGLGFALQVEQDAVVLDKKILQTIQDINASPAFGTGGSLEVGISLLALEPKINTTLADVASKNKAFGDLGVIVLASLKQLKKDTDTLGQLIVPKLDALEQALAPAIISGIDNAFANALAAYQT
ncbi:hydrophobic surface binding protein A-domain-containing protein [Talaromyces proteolyticus]|uniref:Hydrophobic surface binding protein A-domain-containing protein n=1 Tax=Talaromyces proteolyticus TaxID=1131652 RepID=A0AAD4L3P9_9EURO|nr:hydrophobic surface binding protein A-domain-containing protein [Talaromyces proteolyticus]KAH8705367.1 hydrophobic surface binding protein A-domain-containing protein [Talaromyces proteolyticus]